MAIKHRNVAMYAALIRRQSANNMHSYAALNRVNFKEMAADFFFQSLQ